MIKDSVSPFINSTSYIEDYEEYKSIIEKIGIFNSFRYKWPIMKAYYEIFFHNRMKYLVEPLKKISKNFNIKNKLDAMMALHMCTTIKYSLILEEDALTKYSKLGEGIMLSKNNYKIIEFIDYLKLKIDFDKISKKIVDIYSRWINDFDIYLPVVLIELRKNKTKSIDNNNGLYSIYYNVLSFYQDSYELILDMIVFAIGLNNIEERGDYNCFPEKIGVKDFENLYKNTKYNRVNYIKDDEVYSKYIDMDRNIRNSIAHFDYEYDNEKQLFTFNDYNKENVSHKKISLYEFEIMCYENLKMIMYLNEIFYSIRRISYLDEGLKPNINPSFKNNMLYF